ncbi:MAG: DNA methyltransferase [Candidatus Treponema excrementipullorum]|nr:N-6 DNA methylase [Spirochaetia bacterium]MCI6953295.1 N-6 DNA methylase [Spirochaetia bacterium]MCI7588439.1 N-6 DNA methylase [Spirochaetia bacterium]MDY4466550.1 DNA methyltransferase [Candidatus Treponema excrementipullorum]
MTQQEQQKNAKEFAAIWADRGDEKSETHNFWIGLLHSVFGIENAENIIEFEKRVSLGHTSFIDAYIENTSVLIEQKSIDIDLHKAYKQSDGEMLTPFQQAHRYASNLPRSLSPRWIITCNFKSFLVYDMERPNSEPQEILLKNLEKEYYRLSFIAEKTNIHLQKEMELSIKAGDIVGEIYDKLLKQYKNPDSEKTLKSLNMLCVRLVFCLYAEDAGIFKTKSQFHDFLQSYSAENLRDGIIALFKILDTKEEDRDPESAQKLLDFPYVNGGLFTEEDLSIPQFNQEIKDLLLEHASADFDWSDISPTIFGAVFESTLNPETRRSGGMHYTSIENIHKVIDPLFMEDLQKEFDEICKIKTKTNRNNSLRDFQKKLGSLTFLDPACGSGNFLTETYLSLRKLENKCIKRRLGIEGGALDVFGDEFAIQVNISQFYGIEINDFAVVVAKTALWIAESQMMKETANILQRNLDFLPLKSYTNIIEDNALRIDWETVVPKQELNYIMGNPPFVGKKEQSKKQKEELTGLFPPKIKGIGNLDYVCGWYVQASNFIKNTNIHCAFVSTNSITQGEQASIIWKYLLVDNNIHINFAYRTFRWDSEANIKAHVHCVIIGFSAVENIQKAKRIYTSDASFTEAKNINGYLLDAPNIFIESRTKSICPVPKMNYGSMPIDDGHLILEENDVKELVKENKENTQFIKEYAGGEELIKNNKRWCLWLLNISPEKFRKSKFIMKRIEDTKMFRLSSSRPQTLALADTPYLFGEIRQPKNKMIAVPKVSSERRRYIPISIISPDIIVNGSTLIIPDADLYTFGILTSNVHNAWMRAVCGRLEMRYQYSANIVYNTFPWPAPTAAQKAKIEQTAQGILDARSQYPDSSLADLYDETVMPAPLRKAHQENDKAVMTAYGFDWKNMSESECVAELFKMYEKLTKK